MQTQIKTFKTAKDFNLWLQKYHTKSDGIWIKFHKKSSGLKSILYPEAVDEALCFGWIDSQVKSFDEKSYLQKFTPRRSKSIWSKVNRLKVAKLIKEKRMQPAGLVQVKAAKKDGRWEAAYDSPSTMTVPKDFLEALVKNKRAYEFYKTLKKTNLYAIAWRIQTAKKEETKKARINAMIGLLAKKQKIGFF